MGPPLVFTALPAVGLIGDELAIRIDLVAVLVAGVAGDGDVGGLGLLPGGSRFGGGDELPREAAVELEVDPVHRHLPEFEVEHLAAAVVRHRGVRARTAIPAPDLITRPPGVLLPEVEAGGEGLGGGEGTGHALLRRHHGGSGPDGLVPAFAEGV